MANPTGTETEVAAAKASGRQFDIDGTLRGLGRWLLAVDGLPSWLASSKFADGGRLRDEEHSLLLALSVQHLERHATATHPCRNTGRTCRAVGVAQAIYCGCNALRDRRMLKHADQLRTALWEADQALKRLMKEADDYAESCKLLHEGPWKPFRGKPIASHDHERVCMLPERLKSRTTILRRAVGFVVRHSLASQYASRAAFEASAPGRKPRPMLVTEMQAQLAMEGWDYGEIARLVDDRDTSEDASFQVKDRIRKRVMSWVRSADRAAGGGGKTSKGVAPEARQNADTEPPLAPEARAS